jgi:hypothetical protein
MQNKNSNAMHKIIKKKRKKYSDEGSECCNQMTQLSLPESQAVLVSALQKWCEFPGSSGPISMLPGPVLIEQGLRCNPHLKQA